MATAHQSVPASDSGLNKKIPSGTRIPGRLPKMVSSMRSMAKLAAASSSRMTPAVSGQSYIPSRDCSQATVMPSGSRWPESTSIR